MPRLGLAASLFVATFTAFPAAAQDGWTTDYNEARKEAKAKNRPLIIDVFTPGCAPCKQLELGTFRDPAVMKRLADQFIAVRIDGSQTPAFVGQMGIEKYPTLVFAAPDGRVLGKHVGFVDAARFQQQLDRAVQESAVSAKGFDMAAAPAPLRPAAPVARGVASDQPRALLTQIRADHQAKLYASCLERCKELLVVDPTGPDAAEAQRLADDIKNDPEKARALQAALMETLGDLYLANAETAMRQGRWLEATVLLERVQQMCPASPQALTAKNHELKLRSKLSGPAAGAQAP
jgi:thioredoxin-like negative regulator of GroEL